LAFAGAVLASLLLSDCASRPSTVTPITPPQPAGADAGDPAIACDPAQGDVLLGWLAGDSTGYRVWFARSADRGATWSAPVPVSPPGEPLSLQPESPPRMVCDGEGRVAIAWRTSVEMPGWRSPASDLRFARSLDRGVTWSTPSTPSTLNDDTASGPGSHAFHDIALLGHGTIVAAWLDSRPGGGGADSTEEWDASIHLTQSDDFGAHWKPNSEEWSRACPCSRVSLATDLLGFSYVAFRKHYPGNIHDVVIARPGGPPVRAHLDGWQVEGCPHSGPQIVMSTDGTLRLAWFTGTAGRAGVWFQQSEPASFDSSGAPLPVLVGDSLPTVHVSLGDAGMGGTLVACDADSSGERRLMLARIEASGKRVSERFVVPGTHGVSRPCIAARNTSADAYLVWTSHDSDRGRLHMARWRVGR
jgi:hypothetical protein